MNRDISAILSEDYTQKQFFENSILNSIIIFKNIVLDYFKYFLFYLSPLSRYEFWCFSVFTAVTIIVLFALVSIITITFPASKIYIFTLFYMYVFIVINIAIRVFASRLLSVKMYINHVEQVQNKIPMLAKAENLFKKIFLSVTLYVSMAYIKLLIVGLYFSNMFLFHSEVITNIYDLFNTNPVLYLIIFILKVITIIYTIFMVSPSLNRVEYLEHKKTAYYRISYYKTWYTKEYFVDYLTLAASIFSVIAVGHLLIIGYSLTCHLIMSLALLFQSLALLLSGRFFCVVTGFVSIILFIISSAYIIINGVDFFQHSDNMIELVKYYQVAIALSFFGIFYYSSFDRDILKMIAVLGCYLAALFLWEDQTAIKRLMVYDNHAIPVLIYGLVGLFTFFIYLIRVANSKGLYQSDRQYLTVLWSDFRATVTLIKVKYIYMIIFYSSVTILIYIILLFIYPIVSDALIKDSVDAYIFSFLTNIRRLIAFYMLLGLYLLFKNYNDTFPMLIIAFVVALEMYVILYPSLGTLLPSDTLYPLKYVYMYIYIYGLMFILSISLSKYCLTIAAGFALSIVPFIMSLIGILMGATFTANSAWYNVIMISLIIANMLAAYGSHRHMKQEQLNEHK